MISVLNRIIGLYNPDSIFTDSYVQASITGMFPIPSFMKNIKICAKFETVKTTVFPDSIFTDSYVQASITGMFPIPSFMKNIKICAKFETVKTTVLSFCICCVLHG